MAGAVERWAGGTGSDSGVLRKAAAKARATGIQASSLLSKKILWAVVGKPFPNEVVGKPMGAESLET